jgi:hypothetical protein
MQAAIYVAGFVLAIAWIVLPLCFLVAVGYAILTGTREEDRHQAMLPNIDSTQPASL